jgi:hypothetical protein
MGGGVGSNEKDVRGSRRRRRRRSMGDEVRTSPTAFGLSFFGR